MENKAADQSDRKLAKILLGGCSTLACLSLLASLATYTAIYRSEIPMVKNYFPAPTLTPTLVPHFLVHSPSNNVQVLKEDFITNHNNWSTYYNLSKVEVLDGKLSLESFQPDSFQIGYCFCKAPADIPFANRYYLQADLSTDNPNKAVYGLVFSLSDEGTFYTFNINPKWRTYSLAKKLSEGWVHLYSGANKTIKPYPEVNTLSVYYDYGSIELYVNGEQLTIYKDQQPLNEGQIGIYNDGIDFRLIVDNLFAYNEK